eukprot:CAMPEP_0184517200 /NCGR_PEP_ID=MMETSP0198_2-20121128/5432_1 /TAXON_ID=1112570 /ORGANISM="Thraustochytrium sp., Strain LLF1b" /LENGTH=65 /DNA_ID=CAMNT_0026907565 /DNA_START=538 /DNA_END=732 /DNA_ORIENTATION=+
MENQRAKRPRASEALVNRELKHIRLTVEQLEVQAQIDKVDALRGRSVLTREEKIDILRLYYAIVR